MAEKTLIAKIQNAENDSDTLLVESPVVGVADGAPKEGVFLNPLDRVITMKILNERYVLRLPRDVHGRVTEVCIPNAHTPMGYGQPIARLDPRAMEGGAEGASRAGAAEGASGDAESAHLITVDAPSEGIFYRRPSPDSPVFVEVGAPVTNGTVLGLVEIMKCFYQITYGGPDLPETGEVVKILAENASEVRFGQPLFQVRPA